MNRRSFLLGATSLAFAPHAMSADYRFPTELYAFPKADQKELIKSPHGPGDFFSEPRASFGHTRVRDTLYIVGGHLKGYHDYLADHFTDQFLSYDLKAKKWKRLRPYPFPVQGLRLAEHKGWIYAFGGFHYEAAFDYSPDWMPPATPNANGEIHWSARSTDQVFRYKIGQDKAGWQLVCHMPRRRSSNLIIKNGNRIFQVAGWDGTLKERIGLDVTRQPKEFHRMIDVFDTEKLAFVPYSTNIAEPVRRALTSADINGKLALIGGLDTMGKPIRQTTVFDPANNTFDDTAIPPLKYGLFSAGACFTGKKLVVAGGMKGGPPPWESDIQIWVPGTPDWQTVAKLSKPSIFIELLPLGPDRVLAFGGFGTSSPAGMFEEIAV